MRIEFEAHRPSHALELELAIGCCAAYHDLQLQLIKVEAHELELQCERVRSKISNRSLILYDGKGGVTIEYAAA